MKTLLSEDLKRLSAAVLECAGPESVADEVALPRRILLRLGEALRRAASSASVLETDLSYEILCRQIAELHAADRPRALSVTDLVGSNVEIFPLDRARRPA